MLHQSENLVPLSSNSTGNPAATILPAQQVSSVLENNGGKEQCLSTTSPGGMHMELLKQSYAHIHPYNKNPLDQDLELIPIKE